MQVRWSSYAWDDYCRWAEAEIAVLYKINDLINDVRRHPFMGIGKPEALKGDMSGFWSRRITAEHRLVYEVRGKGDEQYVLIHMCRHHYKGK
jgi:toxin YoeB